MTVGGSRWIAIALAGCAACAGAPRRDDPQRPRIEVVADIKATGAPCGSAHPVELLHGPLPLGMVLITRGTSTALHGRRAGLPAHEELIVKLARRFCAQGVSVLRAEEEEGAMIRVAFALWRRPLDGEHDLAPGQTPAASAAEAPSASQERPAPLGP